MRYVRLGNAGLSITEITYGCALTIGTENKSEQYASTLINKAWELGIRSFDASNNYGNGEAERLIGATLKKYPRDEYVLSTKGSWPIGKSPYHKGLSRKHIMWAFKDSMKRLNVDYIDIYYAHRYDPEVPMDEIVRTFNALIQTGKILYWATSEWPLDALKECHAVCDRLNMERPIAEQFIYSYAVQKAYSNGVLEYCRQNNVGTLGFSPLCQGYLTGKYRDRVPPLSRIAKSAILDYDKTVNFYNQNQKRIDHFLQVCDEYGYNGGQIALLWCLNNGVYPVLGASNPAQLEENVQALSLEIENSFWDKLQLE
jgi:aryl-alcohol dehydrogenase-like predicted oxidoreductase